MKPPKNSSRASSLFDKSRSLPKPRNTAKPATPTPTQPAVKKRRSRPSRRDIIQQRLQQSQHPLIQTSLDFPGVFDREYDALDELPWEEQVTEMAQAVRQHGLCVMRSAMNVTMLEAIAKEARALQSKLCRALDQKGILWNVNGGQVAGTFRFQEAASRCKGRMDVAMIKNDRGLIERSQNEKNILASFYSNPQTQQVILQNPKVYPVIQNLLGAMGQTEEAVKLVYAGLIFNMPHSDDQPWHQDGVPLFPEASNSADMQASFPPYALNVFIPLETSDGAVERGPTEFLPGSHQWSAVELQQVNIGSTADSKLDETSNIVSPILKQGDVLIYDYRVCHRGTSNLAQEEDTTKDSIGQGTRRILYLMYARPWFTDHINFDYTQSAESIWSS